MHERPSGSEKREHTTERGSQLSDALKARSRKLQEEHPIRHRVNQILEGYRRIPLGMQMAISATFGFSGAAFGSVPIATALILGTAAAARRGAGFYAAKRAPEWVENLVGKNQTLKSLAEKYPAFKRVTPVLIAGLGGAAIGTLFGYSSTLSDTPQSPTSATDNHPPKLGELEKRNEDIRKQMDELRKMIEGLK